MGECCGSEDGGEAHELKQGAHDEEEEPMYYNTHTHIHSDMYWKTCAHTRTGSEALGSGGALQDECFFRWGEVGPVTSKVLGHSPPLPWFPPSSSPSPSAGMRSDADDVTSSLCSPSFCSSAGTRPRERARERERGGLGQREIKTPRSPSIFLLQ